MIYLLSCTHTILLHPYRNKKCFISKIRITYHIRLSSSVSPFRPYFYKVLLIYVYISNFASTLCMYVMCLTFFTDYFDGIRSQ